MNPQLIFGTLITFFHDLFTAIWIGGMFVLLFVTLPSLKKADLGIKVTQKTAQLIQKRMQIFTIISIAGIIFTGLLLAKRSGQAAGLFAFTSQYTILLSIKHIFSIIMVLLSAARITILNKTAKKPSKKLGKFSTSFLIANFACGSIVLILSALLSILP